ncbi:hypothetical protein RJT34_16722 [Clitoria ternatea]|uniref:Uncharacterized protein n=1 Tax=Clitoria ternatea TaxID=43366 RepID=A0AAN9J7P4_CLITE
MSWLAQHEVTNTYSMVNEWSENGILDPGDGIHELLGIHAAPKIHGLMNCKVGIGSLVDLETVVLQELCKQIIMNDSATDMMVLASMKDIANYDTWLEARLPGCLTMLPKHMPCIRYGVRWMLASCEGLLCEKQMGVGDVPWSNVERCELVLQSAWDIDRCGLWWWPKPRLLKCLWRCHCHDCGWKHASTRRVFMHLHAPDIGPWAPHLTRLETRTKESNLCDGVAALLSHATDSRAPSKPFLLEVGSSGWKSTARHVMANLPLTTLENPEDQVLPTPGRTDNRIRSTR